jgi:transposase
LVTYLHSLPQPCVIAFEPTGDYHRAVMHRLGQAGFPLCQVSSVAVARTRDAMYNSWDKNDPKDAQVILHLLKTGTTQRFVDPLVSGHHDLQEMANTYQQVSLRKVRLQHAIVTHHLPLYFPEAERYLHSSRAEWFTSVLRLTPCPAAVRQYSKAAFIAAARAEVAGHKSDKSRWLSDFYETAGQSVALPVRPDSAAISMFRVVLEEYQQLCQRRKALEADIVTRVAGHPDFDRLQTVPGIGPILALLILAEAGDLRRFGHVRHPGSFEARRTYPSAATLDCATPAGWPAPSLCGCSRTAFAGSLRTICDRIRSVRTDDARRTPPSPRKWRASSAPWSPPASTIAASQKRRDQAVGSLRHGPWRRPRRPRR